MLEKITGYAPVKSAGSTKKANRSGSVGAFADLLGLSDDAEPVSQLGDVAPTAPLGGMLALQEISDEELGRKQLIKQGNSMLDALEELRRRLLMGTIPAHTLHDLAHQLSIRRQQVADPQLMALMDDIELRVAVELAKLEGAFSGNR